MVEMMFEPLYVECSHCKHRTKPGGKESTLEASIKLILKKGPNRLRCNYCNRPFETIGLPDRPIVNEVIAGRKKLPEGIYLLRSRQSHAVGKASETAVMERGALKKKEPTKKKTSRQHKKLFDREREVILSHILQGTEYTPSEEFLKALEDETFKTMILEFFFKRLSMNSLQSMGYGAPEQERARFIRIRLRLIN